MTGIGVDIGGTKVAVGIVDDCGRHAGDGTRADRKGFP